MRSSSSHTYVNDSPTHHLSDLGALAISSERLFILRKSSSTLHSTPAWTPVDQSLTAVAHPRVHRARRMRPCARVRRGVGEREGARAGVPRSPLAPRAHSTADAMRRRDGGKAGAQRNITPMRLCVLLWRDAESALGERLASGPDAGKQYPSSCGSRTLSTCSRRYAERDRQGSEGVRLLVQITLK